jgi:hypothetical protein
MISLLDDRRAQDVPPPPPPPPVEEPAERPSEELPQEPNEAQLGSWSQGQLKFKMVSRSSRLSILWMEKILHQLIDGLSW